MNLRYGIYHIESHLDATLRMVRSRLRESRYAVITISEELYPQAMMLSCQSVKPEMQSYSLSATTVPRVYHLCIMYIL